MAMHRTENQPHQSSSGFSCCQNGESSSVDEDSITNDDSQGNNNNIFHTNNLELNEHHFPKRPPVDIEFRDIRYTVKKFSFANRKFETKEILHGINGAFRSGELTVIMGPSGAGKSTLLNILAGYVSSGATGLVQVNGKNRSNNSQSFRSLSCYIHQDDALRPWLTVEEAMTCAAHLKLGFSVPRVEKNKLIQNILCMLGLDQRFHTKCGDLSGGQKKRLAIALEMINNPPILFLDEPTTGLDSSSCAQCISLLKRLAQDGRTIICTIHQPSALLFEMFDKLYAVAKGHCMYQGPVQELVPFLGDLGLHCPSYHNPADFLMEVAVGEYGADVGRIIKAALKKYYEISSRCIKFEPVFDDNKKDKVRSSDGTYDYGGINNNLLMGNRVDDIYEIDKNDGSENDSCSNLFEKNKPASIIMQFLLLFQRNLLSIQRNYFLLSIRIIAHVMIAIIFGYLYAGVGPNANQVLANYVYLYGSILLIVYTGKMAVMLAFQVEMEILTREHFNRWYNLGPYFFSVVCLEVPVQILCSTSYILISYYLTGNYHDQTRFFYFTLFCVTASICAQSWGFFIGATLSVKLAVFIGPILAVLFSIFGFCTRYVDITPLFRWMWHISYFRASFHGILNSAYGMNRSDLYCPPSEMYCHFRNPTLFLKDMDIENVSMMDNFLLMCLIIGIMYTLTVVVLWYKLNRR